MKSIRAGNVIKAALAVLATLFMLGLSHAYAQERLPSQQEFEPRGGKGQVVIVLSGHTGPSNYVSFAKDLAEQGFYTVLFDGNDFWVKGGGGEDLLKGVITRAQQSPKALPGKVGVIGFSLGGGPALAYATRAPDMVAAVVTYYPLTSFITNETGFVRRIKVPTLVLAAVRDSYKNCCVIDAARKLSAAAKAGDAVPLELVEYPDADHGFNLANVRGVYRGNDASDAFRRTLAHLKQHMGRQ